VGSGMLPSLVPQRIQTGLWPRELDEILFFVSRVVNPIQNRLNLIVLILAVALAILVYLLARRGLGELLSQTVAVPGGVVFFRRAFLLLLIFGGVGQAATGSPDVKPHVVWAVFAWSALIAILLAVKRRFDHRTASSLGENK
jgi:hypothetical protein